MVAYSAKLRQARRPGWEEAYLEYAKLKQSLLEGDLEAAVLDADDEEQHIGSSSSSRRMSTIEAARRRFLGALETEIEKVSLFTLSRQGELADAVGAYRFPAYKISRIDRAPPPAAPPPPRAASPSDWLLSPITKRSGEPVAPLPSFLRTSSRGGAGSEPASGSQQTTEGGAAASTTAPTRPMFRATESLSVNFGDDGAVVVVSQQQDDAADRTEAKSPPPPPPPNSSIMDGYTRIAIELLHLLRYICVNGIGLRKLLKKYDKIMAGVDHNHHSNNSANGHDNNHNRSIHRHPADHIQPLANAASISAIHASLESALQQQQQSAVGNGLDSTTTPNDAPILRLQCALDAIAILREYAVIVNQPFSEFLSHRAMIVTGGKEERKALLMLLQFEPETLAVISESELRAWKRARSQKYQNQKHHRRRTTMITFEDVDLGNLEGTLDEMEAWGGVNVASMAINLASTLLYTVNYYIIAPTANHYAMQLGTDGAFGSTLIGASSFAAIFAAFLYSFWYTRSSFRSALLFSSLGGLLGNVLYATAISYKSMKMALVGRILCGFASAEVANRQLISSCVSFAHMTRASALFVASGAIGMGLGPLLAGVIENVVGTDMAVDLKLPFLPNGGLIINHITGPGVVMASLWLLELLAIVCLFQEPDRINGGGARKEGSSNGRGADVETASSATTYGTSGTSAAASDESNWLLNSDDGHAHVKVSTFREQIISIYLLIFDNPALPVTLYLFAFIELVDEVLISSCSMVVHRYFGWRSKVAGFLIASLGSLVLPADFFVERMAHVHSERKIMKYSLVFLTVCMFGILNYEGLMLDVIGRMDGTDASYSSTNLTSYLNKYDEFSYDWDAGRYVYIFLLSVIFMGTIVLEGVDTSLMSRVTPPRLNDTFINCGLLATLIGTIGRVAGDSMITISALVDKSIFTDFLNATFFPMIPLALLGYFLVNRYYKQFV